MFCSTIIPTVGRHTLARAVNSVLSQSLDQNDFEVIVVNDSGRALPIEEWQTSAKVQIVHTHRRERSIARNTGAAIARGKYLHFLDDDDWLFPDVLRLFRELSQTRQEKWLYGGSQLVNRDGSELIQLHHELQGNCFLQSMAGEWIPLQASMIEAELFHQLGGFSPFLAGPEDIDLFRRACLRTDIVETPNLIAHIERGDLGSTTNYNQHPEMSRQARENILNQENVFHKMRAGANSASWFGKLLRIYLTSAIWNIQQRRISTATSRLMYGVAVILSAKYRIISIGFWSSFARPYQSPTFARGIELSGRNFNS